jgi:hypothetical protein
VPERGARTPAEAVIVRGILRRRIGMQASLGGTMTKTVIAFVVLAAVAVPAAAQKVYVDYDRTVDRSQYKTFAWGKMPPSVLEANHPMVHSFIKESIEYELTGGGFIEDTKNPDLYVIYHTNPKESVQVVSQAYGYSYGAGWGWDPYWGTSMVTGSTQVNTYRKGCLIIDIWDAHTKLAVWRGTATDVMSENPEKALKQLDKAITKIVETYRSMRAKGK